MLPDVDMKMHPDIIHMMMQRRASLGVRELLNQWSDDRCWTPSLSSRLGTPQATPTTDYVMPVPPQRVPMGRIISGPYSPGRKNMPSRQVQSAPPFAVDKPCSPPITPPNQHSSNLPKISSRQSIGRPKSHASYAANRNFTPCKNENKPIIPNNTQISTNENCSNKPNLRQASARSNIPPQSRNSNPTNGNSPNNKPASCDHNSANQNPHDRKSLNSANSITRNKLQSVNSDYSALMRSNSPKPYPHLYSSGPGLMHKRLKSSSNLQQWRDQVVKRVEIPRMKYAIPAGIYAENAQCKENMPPSATSRSSARSSMQGRHPPSLVVQGKIPSPVSSGRKELRDRQKLKLQSWLTENKV